MSSDTTVIRRPFTITQVRRIDGIWYARVTIDGKGTDVDRSYGSWRITPADPAGKYSLVNIEVAFALQAKISPIENAERIKNEKRIKQGLEPLPTLDWPQDQKQDQKRVGAVDAIFDEAFGASSDDAIEQPPGPSTSNSVTPTPANDIVTRAAQPRVILG